jgi:ABC-type polysaccharide/polyol phosphate export permease/glycosyltransferase involved in cell wall biosynthesis
VLYISYDGASEPLGRSQVVAYLLRLAASCDITLISFEKRADDRAETRRLLGGAGIEWVPLAYHARPPVLSTAWDIGRGALAARRAARRGGAQIVHCRSYVPGVMALLSGRRRRWRFLFDIRGFWVDERVQGGLWAPDGPLYRLGKRCERWLFGSADAVVTLTGASVGQIRDWLAGRPVGVHVIPTCADVERYGRTGPRARPRVVWSGSIGTTYRFEQALALADAIDRPLTVLTRQIELARAAIGPRRADLRSVAPELVAGELAPGDIGLCLVAGQGSANVARAPTRLAEYLAAGMVVAVSPGIGDLDTLVTEHGVGVVVHPGGESAVRAAAERLRRLADDPAVRDRCRALAEQRFSTEAGAGDYLSIYRDLLDGDGAAAATGPAAPPRSAASGPFPASPEDRAERVIEPAKRRLTLRRLPRDRAVIGVLAARDFKLKYQQSLLGPLWLVLQPLALLLAFLIAFRGLGGASDAHQPYVVVTLVGLSAWSFFQASMTIGTASVLTNANLVRYTPCPRVAFPLAGILACLPSFAVVATAAVIGAGLTGHLSGRVVLLPLGLLWLLTLTAGIVGITSSLAVRYRDIVNALPLLLQVGVFVAPIGYSLSAMSPTVRAIVELNPLTGLIEAWRWMVLSGYAPQVEPLAVSAALTIALASAGWMVFSRIETTMADEI